MTNKVQVDESFFSLDIKPEDVGRFLGEEYYLDFDYCYQHPNKREYLAFIKDIKEYYKHEYLKLNKKRDKLVTEFSKNGVTELIAEHKQLVNAVTLKIIEQYKENLSFIPVAVFWNGGFARNSNRPGGDYDLNFLYPKKYRDKVLPIEEQICYALAEVVGGPRDYVHAAFCHDKESDRITNISDKGDLKVNYQMNWPNENSSLNYPISPRLESLSWRNYIADRDPVNFENKIKAALNEETCHEWASVYDFIYGKEMMDGVFERIDKFERSNSDLYEKTFKQNLDRIRFSIENYLTQLLTADLTLVSEIKQHYKQKPLKAIFSTLALIRRFLLIEGFEAGTIRLDNMSTDLNIENLLGKELSKKLFSQIYYYIWTIIRLEAVFESVKIRFGTHSDEMVDENFDLSYQEKYLDTQVDFREFHNQALLETYLVLDDVLTALREKINEKEGSFAGKFDVRNEYINIAGYSPFWFLNEVSAEYRYSKFELPFIEIEGQKVPVHPDTFADLGLETKDVICKLEVYPTASCRTVYDPARNVCYKVPLQRRITRGLRDISQNEIERSLAASKLLNQYSYEGFSFLAEECHCFENPNFNFIKRAMPETETFPWFYVVRSQKFSKEFEVSTAENLIKTWMFFASKGIYLEYHCQNILVDMESNIYYRDLSDVRSLRNPVLIPSYANENFGVEDVQATIFDRTLCKQNLDHLFRYSSKLGDKEKESIKKLIGSEIDKYNLKFPAYSFDFPKGEAVRIPQKEELIEWRAEIIEEK